MASFLLIACLIVPAIFFFLLFLIITLNNKKEYFLKTRLEDLQGRINIAYQQLEIEEQKSQALRFKLKRYDALAVLTEKLNQNLSLDDTVGMLLEEVYSLLGQEKSLCLVYLMDSGNQSLSLLGVKSDSPKAAIIKEKNGDIFDQWVIKHLQPLLVSDTSEDFRFDFERIKKPKERTIGSLIACGFISQNRPIGLLRLDSPLRNGFSLEDLRLLNTISDVASVAIDNSRYYQHLKELVVEDSLTGVFTRKFILERLDQEIQRSLITTSPVSIMMLDIDFFKKYNDTYGHLAGDVVLKSLCNWCAEFFKSKDWVMGRYGGEEFLLILPFCGKNEAFSLAESLRGLIQEKNLSLRRKTTSITISGGVANFPQDAKTTQDLLVKADNALYEAKNNGRNRVCLS